MSALPSIVCDEPPTEITQVCRKCAIRQPLKNFGRDKRGRFGHETRCKACSKIQHQECRTAKASLPPKPGPDYCCPICEKANEHADWAPDHDHETGKGRQWICRTCNTGIGRFGDDPEKLFSCLRYLAKHGRVASAETVLQYVDFLEGARV